MQIAFLILNYRNMEETIKCVDSIRSLELREYAIILVDNGSQDQSAEQMTALYASDSHIHLVLLENNLGFSGGNNAGYRYIRQHMDPEFVVVTNNDVLFPQADLYNRLKRVHDQTNFYVFGPDIYVRANHEHQSPMMLTPPTAENMEKELEMYEYYQRHPEKWAKRRKIQRMKNRICQSCSLANSLYNRIKHKQEIDHLKKQENVCVQGACIIVSREYLHAEEKMFSPEPFLYCEEIFLFIKCLRKHYKIIYDPEIRIWHEDSATMKKINANDVKRSEFTLKHHVAARKMVLEYLKQGE